MNLFVLTSSVPYHHHGTPGVTAAHIVAHALVAGLAQQGHAITLQTIFNGYRAAESLDAVEVAELERLTREYGVTLLPPIYPQAYLGPAHRVVIGTRLGRLARLLLGRTHINPHYPALKLAAEVQDRIRGSRPDAVLTIWSPEGVAATYGFHETPKLAYHGDVDFVVAEARGKDAALFTPAGQPDGRPIGKRLRRLRHRLAASVGLAEFRQAHLRLMRDVDVVANVTASNARLYRRFGHPRATYVHNTWPPPPEQAVPAAEGPARSPSTSRIKIIGHVGRLSATGSTYGLRCLLVDTLPVLERVMSGLDYEIHIIGGGEIAPVLESYLRHPRLVVRGFVEDLDRELLSSDALLLLNNAGSFQAAFTRHVVAWSMGLCLVVHSNSQQAIPEIRHGENALVGSTPAEVAECIRLAAADAQLNRRVRLGGKATYEQYFAPAAVAKELGTELVNLTGRH